MFPNMPFWVARILMVVLYSAFMLAAYAVLKAVIPPATRWLDSLVGFWPGTVIAFGLLFGPLLIWAFFDHRQRQRGQRL